jgi:hypothetical protein
MMHQKLNVNRFLVSANTLNINSEKSEDDNQQEDDNGWSAFQFNKKVAWYHLLQAVVVVFIILGKTSKINPDFVFISPQRELIWQSYALLKSDTTSTECTDLQSNSLYQNKQDWILNEDMVDHAIFNFNNTVIIPYLKHGAILHTDVLLAFFFILSFLFQMTNGYILNQDTRFPRIINYIEYSVSSSLMIMVMAVNVGIAEIFTVTSLAGLFFGMNILGACTELMLELSIALHRAAGENAYLLHNIAYWIMIPQIAAWILFLFAVCPVIIQYATIQSCSNTGVPAHVHAAIVLQVVLFSFFGLAQTLSVVCRVIHIADDCRIQCVVNAMDNINIILSFSAKTALAWTLLAPALTVKDSYLT